MSRLLPDVVVSEGRPLTGRVVTISAGRVTELTPVGADEATHPDVVRLPGKALLPGTVNAHCHTFQSLLRGLGDDLDFYAMSPQVVTDVWVRGRQVVNGQRLTLLDQGALMERVRALTRDWTPA